MGALVVVTVQVDAEHRNHLVVRAGAVQQQLAQMHQPHGGVEEAGQGRGGNKREKSESERETTGLDRNREEVHFIYF